VQNGVVVCEIWAKTRRVQNRPFFRWLCSVLAWEGYDSSRCPSVKHSRDLLLDDPFKVSKILVYTLLFAFAFSYQQCTNSFGALQINLYHSESKVIWKVSNNRFPILELLFDPKDEASRWKVGLTKLVLLHCKSTQLTMQLHHEGKLYSTCSVVNYLLKLVNTCNFCYLPDLAISFFSNNCWYSLIFGNYKCVYPRGCIWFNPDNCCLWIRESS
jgi:hypothetical protein